MIQLLLSFGGALVWIQHESGVEPNLALSCRALSGRVPKIANHNLGTVTGSRHQVSRNTSGELAVRTDSLPYILLTFTEV